MKSLKEPTAQVFGAMVLVHTSAAAMRAVEMGEKVDAVSLRLTLERAAGELESAHSTLVDTPAADASGTIAGREDEDQPHALRAVEAMRTAIDELYAAHAEIDAAGEDGKRLWKAAGDLEELLGAVERTGAKPESTS